MRWRYGMTFFVSCCLTLSLAVPPSWAAAPSAVSLLTANHAHSIYQRLLEAHWIADTGLFLSFPDSSDCKLSQQASLYEQGAVGLLALRLGDTERARSIFDFLKKTWTAEPLRPERDGQRGLSNFYNAYFGFGGIETTIQLGPNAWVTLFAARYANTLHDTEALQWSLDTAYWMMNSLPHEDGAVAMGAHDEPHGAPWAHIYSTENNISYDAMLNELLRSTQIDPAQRAAIARERDRVESWLVDKAFNRTTFQMNRGFNPQGADTIQALDTTTWLLSTLGPRKLAARGIDPDRLMHAAARAYEVTVRGHLGVDAADQKEADFIFQHLYTEGKPARPAADRHRLIWYEGLGQYVIALETMADDCARRGKTADAAAYLKKASRMTDAFDQAALSHVAGRAAYAYATEGRFFRDGWETQARSAQGPASSLIASVWRSFAGLGWDPLTGRSVAIIAPVHVTFSKTVVSTHPHPSILYGTSEQMVLNAWKELENHQTDDAIEQAKATISEWSSWAQRLQDKKSHEVGHLISYQNGATDAKKIFGYWALNDVGAAYFILGKAYDSKGDYLNATRAFQQVVNRYSLAQVWDPQGWFWSPSEAVQSDFVQRDPSHYGAVNPQAMATENAANRSSL